MKPSPPDRPRVKALLPEDLLLLLVTLVYIFWIFSLPVFPSTDAPMHLYITRIFGELLSGGPSVFSQYFYVKHVLPPYALYYYILMGLSHFMSLERADKTVIALIVALTVYGFRYVAVWVGASARLASLFVVLLTVSAPLCTGFASYCLSLALCFWGLGLWIRIAQTALVGRRIAFVALTVVIMLSHPMPLLLLLLFIGCDVLVELWQDWRSSGRLLTSATIRQNVATVALASLNLVYVAYFARESPRKVPSPLLEDETHRRGFTFMNFLRGSTNLHTPFNQKIPAYHGVHILIELILPIGLILAFLAWRRQSKSGAPGERYPWFFIALAGALALFPTPDHLPGYYALAPRLAVVVWMMALLSASLCRRPSLPAQIGIAALAIFMNGATLYCLDTAMRPAANERLALSTPPAAARGEQGILLFNCAGETCTGSKRLDYDAQAWGGVNFFSKNDAILLNSPWLELPNIPIGLKTAPSNAGLPPTLFEMENMFQRAMHRSPEFRHQLLADASVVVLVKDDDPPSKFRAEDILAADSQAHWSCAMEQRYWEICRKTGN